MMHKSMAVALISGFALYACGSSGSQNAYDLAADQVDQAASALTGSTPDDTFTALAQGSSGAAGSAAAAAGATGHRDADRRGKGRDGHGHGKGQGGPGDGLNGQQLLLWYADLTAIQACRDQRTSCGSGDDAGTCDQAARACVKPILEAAFAALCTEKLAMCSDASAPATACERLKSRCASTTSDAGM